MSAVFPVVEYERADQLVWNDETKVHDRWTAGAKIAIDLRWVMSATAYAFGALIVQMAGSASGITILADYSDFMRDWMRARG